MYVLYLNTTIYIKDKSVVWSYTSQPHIINTWQLYTSPHSCPRNLTLWHRSHTRSSRCWRVVGKDIMLFL